MDISSVNSDLIRGNVTTIILGCLKDEDKYGYEILKEIEDKSHSQYALKQATLYNQLKRLEKQGLVSSYDGAPDDTGGGKRRYYALTPEGRNYLLKEKGEYEYARTILDKLVSANEFDFTKEIPFDASELRPYSKRESGSGDDEKPKVVYKDKIVEVEKRIYIDRFGNPLSEEEYERALTQALLDDEQARRTEEELVSALAKLREIEDEQAKYEEQLKLSEQARAEKEKELNNLTEAEREYDEKLRLAEEQRINSELQLHQVEEERVSTEEQLRQVEEQLRLAKEKHGNMEEQLRQLEEERSSTEEQLYVSEIQRAAVEEELRRLREERAEEEERLRIAQSQPSTTVDELFAKLDTQSEYQYPVARPTQIYVNESEAAESENIYLEQPTLETVQKEEQQAQSQTTLEDLFRQIDEKAAKIEEERLRQQAEKLRRKQEELERQQQEIAADALAYQQQREYAQSELDSYGAGNSYGATSAVVTPSENGFEYEKNHVNYRDFFNSIADETVPEEEYDEPQQQVYTDTDIKTRLYAKGFKIRPYDRGNTSEYYTFNFIQSNRINRDTFLIVLALFLAEIAVMWLSLANRITFLYFLPITIVGAVLCLVPTLLYFLNPTRRTRANFNFKLSILNRTMLFIELTVVCILVGFFALGASVNDVDLILCSMVIPAVILLNLPISSVIYWLLYRTRKYHIA